MEDHFSDFSEEATSEPIVQSSGDASQSTDGNNSSQGGASQSKEIFTRKIEAKTRTYFIDLKESAYGIFLKISERSNGRKNIIRIDESNIEEFIEALTEMKKHL